jgi:hypothetical protein
MSGKESKFEIVKAKVEAFCAVDSRYNSSYEHSCKGISQYAHRVEANLSGASP